MSARPVGTLNVAPQSARSIALALPMRDEQQRRARFFVIVFLVAGLLATVTISASGQQAGFEEMQVNPAFFDPAAMKEMELAAKSFAGTGPAKENYAQGYFSTYVPAKMTRVDSLAEMGDLIKNSTVLLSRAQRSNNPRARKMLGWIFVGMKKVVDGNHHPPAKINALLVLGRLDETPANQVTQTPPIPLRYSLPILIKEYKNEANVDGVRAAALQGLHRHVSYGLRTMGAADKASIQAEMTALLASDPPPGRSEKAHAYMQRFAVDMLDLLRANGDSSLGVQLISISTTAEQPDLIALHSAARLGRMSGDMKGKVAAPKNVLESWSTRALNAFESELARLKALDRPKKAKEQPSKPEDYLANKTAKPAAAGGADGGGMMNSMEMMGMDENSEMEGDNMDDMDMMGMMGGMSGMDMGGMGRAGAVEAKPQPPEVIASRRKLNHVLQQLHLGVTGSPSTGLPRTAGGVLGMVTDEQKPEVEAWVTAMEPIVAAINVATLDDRTKYIKGLTEQTEVLRKIAGTPAKKGAAPAKAADPLAADPLAAPADPLAADPLAADPLAAPAAAQAPGANPADPAVLAPAVAPAPAPAAAPELPEVDELASP